jgi:hypothetical protein
VKVQISKSISAFGGINFVFEYLNSLKINNLFHEHLPELRSNSTYCWGDLLYALLSVYFCGGDCIEDIQTNLRAHFKNNPFINLPSSDTVLKRLAELATKPESCCTTRGKVTHDFNSNEVLYKLNLALLSRLDAFKSDSYVLDYDNTILFNEKSDSRMTYKRNPGYQPGVCTLNEAYVLYLENRNGNADAKAFQLDTLTRLFDSLETEMDIKQAHFRADAASYQYEVIDFLDEKVKSFYIGCRNSYVEKYFTQVQQWTTTSDQFGEMQMGSILITPFVKQSRALKRTPKQYRLIVKRRPRKDGQINLITQDAFDYRAILTNDIVQSTEEIVQFYAKRGNMERQFDILKNDFGWQKMPFSTLNKNTVFLYLTAICRNIYESIITSFSAIYSNLKPYYRIKKFIFRFIILPAKWIKTARQQKLKVYNESFALG